MCDILIFVAIYTGKLVGVSVEEIMDCCHYCSCNGWLAANAFKHVHNTGGLCTAGTCKS